MIYFSDFSAGGPPPFDPLNLSPYAWFDADQQTESDLGSIATLVDWSGNSRDFAQGTGGNQPPLRHNIVNGKKVVQFGQDSGGSAGSKFFTRANTFLSGATAGHYFWLMKANADPASGSADGALHGELENHSGDTHIPYGDSNCYTGFLSTTRRSFNPHWDLNQWNVWEEWSAPGDWGVKINGHAVTSSASNTVSINASTRSIGRGNSSSATLGYFRGQMAQMLYFDSKLASGDAEDVLKYLASIAAIQEKLPLGNSEKTYPSATHWRIRAPIDASFGMREMEMYASTDGTGTNLATLTGGNAAISSYNDPTYDKTYAFDGNTSTFWSSVGTTVPAGGHWIGISFASPVSIGSFRVYPRGDFSENPDVYALDYSQDSGTTWKTMMAGGLVPGNAWTVLPT